MTTLESVRAKVMKAVPEGEVQERIDNKHCYRCECMDDNHTWIPLTLADVLRAIDEMSDEKIAIDTAGNFREYKAGRWQFVESGVSIVYWNLALPLDEQSPKVIDFLAKILTN